MRRHYAVIRPMPSGLSVEEAAGMLGLAPATVKTRHFRARRRLQEELAPELKSALSGAFPFAGAE